jgi:hypothetical protein
MSTAYYPLTPIRMADLFGRLKNLGVHEELCEGTTPDEKCLTDGRNFVWVSCSGRELVRSFSCRGDPEHILQVISEEFGVRILREDEYWNGYKPTEESRAAWDAMAEKADREFFNEMRKFVRGEDHDIKPGSVWMIKAEIAKRLTANSPDLLADAKRPDLLKAIEILRVTLSSAFSFENLEVLIKYLKTLLEPQAGGHRGDAYAT